MSATEIFEAYYGRVDPDTIEIPEEMPRLHSYVPFIRGQSHMVLFNFMRQNYNLRDPVLLRIWVEGPGMSQPPRMHQHVFASDAVIHLEPDTLDSWADFESSLGRIHVQLIHPKAATANGEFRFFAFYHSPRGSCAGIHSLGARGLNRLGATLGSRAVLANDRNHYAIDPTQVHRIQPDNPLSMLSPAKASTHNLMGPGFLVSTNDAFEVAAVWHDSDYVQTLNKSDSPRAVCPIRQVFPVSDFPRGLPRAWVDPLQIGFAPSSILFTVFDHQGRAIGAYNWTAGVMPAVIDLPDLFGTSSSCDQAYVVADFGVDQGDFDSPALAYLQLWYPGVEGSGDQVHSQITPSFWTDPLAEAVSYRCRKFAPWVRHPKLRWYYAVINVGGVGGNRDVDVRFRLFTDDGRERLVEQIAADERVTWFCGETLVRSCGLEQTLSAIIQIEAETTNFNAYWMLVDPDFGIHAIDHFTGG